MTSMNIKLTLPQPLMEEAIREGLLDERAISEIVQTALESGQFSKKGQQRRASMSPEERRKNVDEQCDRIKIDTKGHSFSRNEIYEDVNDKYGIS